MQHGQYSTITMPHASRDLLAMLECNKAVRRARAQRDKLARRKLRAQFADATGGPRACDLLALAVRNMTARMDADHEAWVAAGQPEYEEAC